MPITVKPSEAKDALVEAMRVNIVPMLHGSPATGKSSIVQQIADEHNLELIDFRLSQCDPTDLLGFPQIDKEAGKAFYTPMATFPLEGDPVPEGKKGWLLFLDECNSADRATQKAAYKLILDRMVGMEKLNNRCAIMGAGNLATDNAIVEEMGTALQSRMVHLEITVNKNDWVNWANANGINHKVISFINFKPQLLYNFDPNHSDKTFASPRTWEFASKLYTQVGDDSPLLKPLIAGAVGEGAATEFIAYTKVYAKLPTIQQVIKNPTGLDVPHELSVKYAMSGMLAHNLNAENADAILKYVQRLPAEFQSITLSAAVRADRKLLNLDALQEWIFNTGMELI